MQEFRQHHWPNVVSLILDRTIGLQESLQPYFHCEAKRNISYYIQMIEPRMYSLLIYTKDKKPTKDENAIVFLNGISQTLRLTHLFAALTPKVS